MIHHNSGDYAVAASKAAAQGREKMEAMIENGKQKAGAVVQGVIARVIHDSVVKANMVKFHASSGAAGWAAVMPMGNGERSAPLHRHAFSQVISDAELPAAYVTKLENQANGKEWGKELIAHNLNTIFAHRSVQRNLVRESEGVVKGWLSDKFRRLDSRPLLDAFIGACNNYGIVPIEGIASDTKVRIRAILPKVFEPVKDEPMVFGLEWGNSDYGDGGHVVNVFINRVVCTNYAVMDQMLRQIHLGKRLNDDITYSEETYQADTKANVLALGDIVGHSISPARVNGTMKMIESAAEVTVGKDIATILKKYLDKGDVERAVAAFESPDVVNLPPGNTMWRLSNAVSWLANANDISPDRKLELQAVAGELIPHKKQEALAV